MDKSERGAYDKGLAMGHYQADKQAYEVKCMHTKNIMEQNRQSKEQHSHGMPAQGGK